MADFKKLTGRPQLKEGKRNKKIDARFTEKEYQQVLALEKELGITKTELIRMRVFGEAGLMILVNSKELIQRLDAIGTEMGRIGNNINQLARHANTLKRQGALTPETAMSFMALFEQYLSNQHSLGVALRKIIRLNGK
jgi:hypothetical protein